MPRPKKPHHRLVCRPQVFRVEVAEDVAPRTKPDLDALLFAIRTLVEQYDEAWVRQPKPGRPETRRRNERLIKPLVALFDRYTTHRPPHREHVIDFVQLVLELYQFDGTPDRERLARLVN